MPWPTRTDIAGMLGSCLMHAALLGGLLIGVGVPQRKLAPARTCQPLVVTLVPLDQLSSPPDGSCNAFHLASLDCLEGLARRQLGIQSPNSGEDAAFAAT